MAASRGSMDNTVRLWDAVTGAKVKKMEGHSDRISVFSDGIQCDDIVRWR